MAGSKRVIGSDLPKVDAHVIQPEEYDEIPELTDEDFARGDITIGGKLVSKGRPRSKSPKQQITLRLDKDVVERFRATGPGWQSRIKRGAAQGLTVSPM
jgi:uncharacterized protein (DUF4415 family)